MDGVLCKATIAGMSPGDAGASATDILLDDNAPARATIFTHTHTHIPILSTPHTQLPILSN